MILSSFFLLFCFTNSPNRYGIHDTRLLFTNKTMKNNFASVAFGSFDFGISKIYEIFFLQKQPLVKGKQPVGNTVNFKLQIKISTISIFGINLTWESASKYRRNFISHRAIIGKLNLGFKNSIVIRKYHVMTILFDF